MDFQPNDWPVIVISAAPFRYEIDPKPQYQRTQVWKAPKQAKLIDSILRGYPIPEIYFSPSTGAHYLREVTDGQQRLRAIWAFYDDKLPLGNESAQNPFAVFGNLSNKKYSELPTGAATKFQMSKIRTVEITNSTDAEIRELFRRLQEGVPVIPSEYRNSMEGKMRDFIEDLGENHNVFPKTRIKNDRYAWHDLAAIVTCLEIAKGACDVKAPDLKAMYENQRQFNVKGRPAGKIQAVLNYMNRVFDPSLPEMKIKWGFVDLYLLISKLIDEYAMTGMEKRVCDFYINFEAERDKYKKNSQGLLASTNSGLWDKDLYNYIEAFKNQGGTKDNVETRHKVYIRRFLRDNPGLRPKDKKRFFDDTQRTILLRLANSKCQNPSCGQTITFTSMHADHFPIPWSKQGPTTIDNGRALCARCNQQHGNRTSPTQTATTTGP
jgi:5-methylcytosine-specific restriction endonuclease McrA